MIDSIGFNRRFVKKNFAEIRKHIKSIGGEESTKLRNRNLFKKIFGKNYQIKLETYPFIIWPRKITYRQFEKYRLNIKGGYTINGNAHLGNHIHIDSINKVCKIKDKIISFNDLDSKTSIRKTSKDIENKSIKSFRKICRTNILFQSRLKNKEIMYVFKKFNDEITPLEFQQVLGRKIRPDERKSLNIQAAAYLFEQFYKRSLVIGFDAIEESSRVIWINYVAERYNLPGFINLISMQIPSIINNDLKMGKSNPSGSIIIGDKIYNSIKKINNVKEPFVSKIIWFSLSSIFMENIFLLDVKRNSDCIKIIISFKNQQDSILDNISSIDDWIIILDMLRKKCLQFKNKKNELTRFFYNYKNEIISFSSIIESSKLFYNNAKIKKIDSRNYTIEIPIPIWKKAMLITNNDKYSYKDIYEYFYKKNKGVIKNFKLEAINFIVKNYKYN